MTREEFLRLYEKYLSGECSEEEQQKLFMYEDDFELNLKPWNDPLMGEKEVVKWKIFQGIAAKIPSKSSTIWKIAVAAVLVIGLGLSLFLYEKQPVTTDVLATNAATVVNDVLPGSDKAILILADGSTVSLDSSSKGFQIDQLATKIVNNEGGLVYESSEDAAVVYNAVSTPKGGQYRVTLSDGTKVWLNAGSYLRYPTHFKKGEREVELKGEGYFEVKSDVTSPFIVNVQSEHTNHTSVVVTGTRFNINAYENEQVQAITLLEGKLSVNSDKGNSIVQPGQMLRVTNSNMKIIKADIDEVVAWIENRFQFNDEKLTSILRQIERWYDVEVVYDNIPDQRYFGIISRDVPLSQVIKMLELSSNVKFEIKDKKLLVN
jgi:transmembrane sensor